LLHSVIVPSLLHTDALVVHAGKQLDHQEGGAGAAISAQDRFSSIDWHEGERTSALNSPWQSGTEDPQDDTFEQNCDANPPLPPLPLLHAAASAAPSKHVAIPFIGSLPWMRRVDARWAVAGKGQWGTADVRRVEGRTLHVTADAPLAHECVRRDVELDLRADECTGRDEESAGAAHKCTARGAENAFRAKESALRSEEEPLLASIFTGRGTTGVRREERRAVHVAKDAPP
jgi:hypothetical protein